jgi:hypothetical protein
MEMDSCGVKIPKSLAKSNRNAQHRPGEPGLLRQAQAFPRGLPLEISLRVLQES